MEIYSALKAAWHTADIDKLRAGQPTVPRHVYISISDLCNQDCAFCTYRASAGWGSELFGEDTGKGFTMNPNRQIPTAKALEILNDCADLGVAAIQFTGGGEPSVHRDFEKIVTHALDLGFKCGLITNATRILSSHTIGRMSWIRVSIDAGNRRTYEKIRRSKLFDKMCHNVQVMTDIAGPTIGANFVTTRENYSELEQFCILAKSLGCSYVKIAANLTDDGLAYYDGILDDIMAAMARTKDLEDESFKIANVFERRLEDLRVGRPRYAFCGQQRFATYIGGNQKVYRCCNTAFTKTGFIGDLSKTTFKEFWLEESQKMLDNFDARACKHCQFHEKNEIINYLLQDEPSHVDFV